jgi:hypothetical protein
MAERKKKGEKKTVELRFNSLPFKTLDEWEAAQRDEPIEFLVVIQQSLTREIKRQQTEKKQVSAHEKWAEKHGYKLTKEGVKPEVKKVEEVKPVEKKPEEKKPATAAPYQM